MRKLMGTLLIISLLLGLGFAKNSANIPMQGDWELSLEYGSQSQEVGADQLNEKYQLDQLTVLGVDYGINEKWGVGLSMVAPSVIEAGEGLLTKHFSKPSYLELGIDYQLAENWLVYLDYGTQKGVISKDSPAVSISEDQEISNTITTLGLAASKKCLLNDDITWGAKLGYNTITVKLDEELESVVNDLPRTSLTLELGGDYMINEMWSAYITAAHTFPSSVIGKYDDDATLNNGAKIGFDQQDSLILGIMATL